MLVGTRDRVPMGGGDALRAKHNIMIAYNSNDQLLSQTTDYHLLIEQHKYMERKEVNLFLKEELLFAPTSNDEDINYEDFTINTNFSVSKENGTTQYWCTMFNNTENLYGTGFSLIDTTSQNIVHHIGLLSCPEEAVTFNSDVFPCSRENFQLTMECKPIIFLAAGSSAIYPSQIHQLIPKGLYILEIHFDLPNVIDNTPIDVKGSGIRAIVSNTPRNKELSIIRLEVGDFEIPPKHSNFVISFAMHNGCIKKYIPENGADILFIAGHMHYLGESISLDRIRYPNKLENIFTIKKWDFDRQFAYPVQYTLKQGDTLRVKCIYNSMNRENITYHGESSDDEMCQIYLGVTGDGIIDELGSVFSTPSYGDNDDILKPTYCGSDFIDDWNEIELTGNEMNVFYNNLSIKSNNDNLDILSYRNELCHALTFDLLDLIPNDLIFRFDLPYITLIPSALFMLAILICLYLIQLILKTIKPGIYMEFINHIEHERKINIYAFSTIYYTIMLIFLLIEVRSHYFQLPECQILYNEPNYNHSSDNYPSGVPIACNMTILYFVIEKCLLESLSLCKSSKNHQKITKNHSIEYKGNSVWLSSDDTYLDLMCN